jgi:hypothetical protein
MRRGYAKRIAIVSKAIAQAPPGSTFAKTAFGVTVRHAIHGRAARAEAKSDGLIAGGECRHRRNPA